MQRSSFIILSAITLFTISCSNSKSALNSAPEPNGWAEQDVVYGEDDRMDLYQVSHMSQLALADSTVALMHDNDLSADGQGTSYISTSNFGKRYNLCESEPYREQGTAAFCSGFLVDDDTLVTAGHCIRNQTACNSIRFVFGFAVKEEGVLPTSVPTQDVYSCKELIRSSVDNYGADFAVVRLDRPVADHRPLRLRQQGEISPGAELVVIGHPAGLPTKVAGGARVRRVESEHLVANLDTYGGNSGSAVFNANTGEVEGILVRGAMDFVYQNGCRVSNRCADDGCRGEDVTKISEALPYIPFSN